VTAIDIQEYARVLCSAVLNPSPIHPTRHQEIITAASHSPLRDQLLWAAEPLVEYEGRALHDAKKGEYEQLCNVLEARPLVEAVSDRTKEQEFTLARTKTMARLNLVGLGTGPRSVALRHFGGTYFSYSQAVDLACALETAHTCTLGERDTVLAAVLSTASAAVNTVGKQFAQPLRPRDASGTPKVHQIEKMVNDRQINVMATFADWLGRYGSIGASGRPHRASKADFRDALRHSCDDVSVIYADPPYTRDHYSRYYHALETMSLRDDPQMSASNAKGFEPIGRGAYRNDRHQSPFCIKSQAPKAFMHLFEGVASLSVPLILSYSPRAQTSKPRPRVMDTDDLLDLAKRFFRQVEWVVAGAVSHSKLNKASFNSEISHDAERFLICL
jgi:hypothetical protein